VSENSILKTTPITEELKAAKRQGKVSFEQFVKAILRVGIFRPILGAIFALVVYAILQSGLLAVNILNTSAGEPNSTNSIVFFYYVVGFLAGFSERWVPDIIEIAQKRVSETNAQIKSG